MKYISHRGNLNGKDIDSENTPEKIRYVLKLGLDCEIDLWSENNRLYLGHDFPEIQINQEFIFENKKKLWIHCKNFSALKWCKLQNVIDLNFFWHERDLLTLTSLGHIWVYPGNQPKQNSIAVLPELNNEENLQDCFGICSDIILEYKSLYEKV
jgi:hypothetical protein